MGSGKTTALVVDPVERFTALPWVAWGLLHASLALATNNLLVLAGVAAASWVTAVALGGPRAQISRLAVTASVALAAVWAVLAVLIRREGLGGEVLWLLPEWSSATSGQFGGPVTTGQIHLSAARGVQALAVVALLALVLRVVSARAWNDVAVRALGGASRVVTPLLCLPQGWTSAREEAEESRRSGFGAPSPAEVLGDALDRTLVLASVPAAGRGGGGAGRTVAYLAATVALAWGVSTSINGAAWPHLPGAVLTILVLAGLVLAGMASRRTLPPRPTRMDLLPLAGGLVVAAAWAAGAWTGERELLGVDHLSLPGAPITLLAALTATPALALAVGGRR